MPSRADNLPARDLRQGAALLLGALLTAAAPVRAQVAPDVSLPRVDSIFAAFADPAAPGCATAVVLDGRFALARGYGSSNLDYGIPLDGRSVFYLASVSKQFTAAAVALAAAEGHLSLDDDVRRFVPELPDYGAAITVRHLVHHTSGLRDYLTLIPLAGRRADDHWSDAALLELITRQRALNFRPGSEYLYSNTGYVLLAEIVRRATGLSLRDYTDARFFRPLGMHATHFHDDAGAVVPRRVIGYSRTADGAHRINHWFAFDKVGDGGLYSSVEDLARWEESFHAGTPGGAPLLEQLLQRGVLTGGDTIAYAFGLNLGRFRGLPTVEHGGSLAGFRTVTLRIPSQRFSAVVLCNTPAANPSQLARRLAELYLNDVLEPAPAAGAAAAAAAAARPPVAAPDRDEPPAADAAALAVFAGSYHSDELDAGYTIRLVGHRLLLRRGQADTVLSATSTSTFAAGGLVLRFADDARSFTLDAGRVRGIVFHRTD
jgi:CubicO group peptidase (beta-lactamase class C family)